METISAISGNRTYTLMDDTLVILKNLCNVTNYIANVEGLILVTYLQRTPIFEWWLVRCGSRSGHQKDMFLKEIELCAQNLLTYLGGPMWPSYGSLSMESNNS